MLQGRRKKKKQRGVTHDRVRKQTSRKGKTYLKETTKTKKKKKKTTKHTKNTTRTGERIGIKVVGKDQKKIVD